MKAVAALLLPLLASAAHATTMGVHLGTWHSKSHYEHDGRVRPYCQANPGVYGRLDNGLTFGAYRNSYCRGSVYAGWTWERRLFGSDRVSAGVTLGAVTGYPAKGVMPVAAPSIRFGLADGYSLRFSGLPKLVKSQHSSALHLSIEREF